MLYEKLILSSVLLLPLTSFVSAFDISTALVERDANYDTALLERDLIDNTDGDSLYKRCDTCDDDNQPKHPKPKPKGKKIYQGIDFSRQRGHNYVRFILAESITAASVPVVIDIPNCMDYVAAGHALNDPDSVDTCYDSAPLQTRDLQPDARNARNCQSYSMTNKLGGNSNLTKFHGYPIGVSISNDTTSTIGWDFDKDTSNITWLAKFTPNQLSGKFSMDCKTWWEKEPHGPQWHGKTCLLRMVNSDNLCIAADRETPGAGKPLLYQTCNSKNSSQIWNLQATALEWSDYGGNCGQACWGKRYNQDPTLLFNKNGTNSTS